MFKKDPRLSAEEEPMDKEGLKRTFIEWAAIVEGCSSVEIHGCSDCGNGTALAWWETSWAVRRGQTLHAVDISSKRVQGYTIFAAFTINDRGQISQIVQRSDDIVRKLGIERQVLEARWAKQDAQSK